ncbi:hypothetical protein N0V85_007966 [Neurospora sp. IMI 360204]|nr:hypothetical protein N0V85_007966 [Neurospora sp. IMI 360204]
MESSDEDLFADQEMEDTLLEDEFLAAKEMPEDTLNANGNGNGNGHGGPQQLPDQAPMDDNIQPQPHHDQGLKSGMPKGWMPLKIGNLSKLNNNKAS